MTVRRHAELSAALGTNDTTLSWPANLPLRAGGDRPAVFPEKVT
jgi:hypothetical protein